MPSIEDIELGYRIRRAGFRIAVDPTLLGKHLKVWTPRNALFTDIFRRALPWSRLMIAREGVADDLNTSKAERAKALVAGLLILSVLALPFAPQFWPLPILLSACALALELAAFRFHARARAVSSSRWVRWAGISFTMSIRHRPLSGACSNIMSSAGRTGCMCHEATVSVKESG